MMFEKQKYILALLFLYFLYDVSSITLADCTSEVQQSFARQSNSEMLRKNMNLIGEEGPFQMTIEYIKPDRMRQIVKTVVQPDKTSETILIGDEAWEKGPDGWIKLNKGTTDQIKTFFTSTLTDLAKNVGVFECMGAETIEGKKLRLYKGKDEPKSETPEFKEAKKKEGGEEPKNEAVRVVYVDIETSLPSHIVFAREGMLDRPIFKEVYSYPTDLKIERPTEIKP